MEMVSLPSEAIAAVRNSLGPLVDGIVASVRAENEVYADVLGGPEGMGIRLGIEQTIKAFLDAVERGERPGSETGEVWRRLGEAEFQAGRSLDALRAAFRTGTRATWRGAADLAVAAGIDAQLVIALAEAIFLYTDELAADVVEGYLRIQSDEAGERERRRRRLASLLLDAAAYDPEAVGRAAELARWPLPRTLAVLALDGDSAGSVTRGLDLDALVGTDAHGSWLVVPDPSGPGRRASLQRTIHRAGVAAALGPAVAPRDAHRSLRWARLALELVGRRLIPDERPTVVTEHLPSLVVLQQLELARALVEDELGPLAGLPDGERRRLLSTLEAWLAHQRHTPSVAAALHVHPQTVRYRVGRLRELLGDRLDTPDGRFGLELALRAQRAVAPAP